MAFNNQLLYKGTKPINDDQITKIELDYHRIDSFTDIRVLNDFESSNANTISEEDDSQDHIRTPYEEVKSEDLAILSTSSSNFSYTEPIITQTPSNSQKIDDWCSNNELLLSSDEERLVNTTTLRIQDINSWEIDPDISTYKAGTPSNNYPLNHASFNYTSSLLSTLTSAKRNKAKQLARELLPYLTNSRRRHQNFNNNYNDIPSVFTQQELILACSLRYTDFGNNQEENDNFLNNDFSSISLDDTDSSIHSNSWLGCTLVLTDTDL